MNLGNNLSWFCLITHEFYELGYTKTSADWGRYWPFPLNKLSAPSLFLLSLSFWDPKNGNVNIDFDQKSLKRSSFCKILFFRLVWVTPTTLVFQVLIQFSVSSNVLLILVYIFIISAILFFCSVRHFFIFSNSVKCLSMFIHPYHEFLSWVSFWSLPWTLNQIDYLSPLHLVLLGVCLVLLFGIYSSVSSISLILDIYFYVLGRLVTFPNLGEVCLCRKCSVGQSSTLPCGHQSYML